MKNKAAQDITILEDIEELDNVNDNDDDDDDDDKEVVVAVDQGSPPTPPAPPAPPALAPPALAPPSRPASNDGRRQQEAARNRPDEREQAEVAEAPRAKSNSNTTSKAVIMLILLLGLVGGFFVIWRFVLKDGNGGNKDWIDAAIVAASSAPSVAVSSTPSVTASSTPSAPPSLSNRPSQSPSALPTNAPSAAPTLPEVYVPPHPIPDPVQRSYFNYDVSDARFGPDQGWVQANMTGTYYREFGRNGFGVWAGHLKDHVADATLNRCDAVGKQSPINVERTNGTPGACNATHQIRTRPGIHPLKSSEIEKRIESNKLRLVLPRRPCLDPDNVECLSGRPPEADFPRYSTIGTHYSDLLNLDIKVPGEHRILNETFDAEIQMLHIHLTASRMGQIGLPVRATKGGHNQKFQALLDQFQLTYEANQAACAASQQQRRGRRRRRRLRRGTAVADEYHNAEPYTHVASLEERGEVNGFQRQLQNGTSSNSVTSSNGSSNATSNRFDPYTDFLPTVFFYRYEGSSTEPPCMSMTWFVMTHPLIISYSQLRQVKRLIFTNVDESCWPTSVHNVDQSVARPIQPLGLVDDVSGAERPVMLCKEGNFLPDP